MVQSQIGPNRDRGEPRGSAPPTPPDIRVRIRRFGGLCRLLGREGSQAERAEEGVRQGNGERGAVAEPPRAMWAAGGLCRQVPADAAASQLGKAGASTLPLLPGDGAQPPPDPLVKCAQHRRSFAEAEVAAPSDEIARQLLGDLRAGSPRACAASAPGPSL